MRGPECNGRAGKFSAGGVCEKFSEPLGAGSAADAGGCAEVTAGQNRKARRENKNSFHRTERSGVRFGGRPQGGPDLLAALLLGEAIEKARTLWGYGPCGLRLWSASGLFGRWGGGACAGATGTDHARCRGSAIDAH